MKTNEEFFAEVYRRREDELKKRSKRAKRIMNTLICLPLCAMIAYLGLSLAIAMQPAGGADKNEATNARGESHSVRVEEGDAYREALLAFFSKIEAREPNRSFGPSIVEQQSYRVYIDTVTYFVCEDYVLVNNAYFAITEEEFTEFLSIIGE